MHERSNVMKCVHMCGLNEFGTGFMFACFCMYTGIYEQPNVTVSSFLVVLFSGHGYNMYRADYYSEEKQKEVT